jgi:Domain of unknown function (DUF6265)
MMMRTMLAGLALMFSLSAAADEAVPLPNWLHGAWNEARAGGGWADEFWTPPRGDLMIGAARMGTGDRITMFEHSRIVRMPDGKLAFVAQPFGNPATHFPLVDSGEQMLEFANAAHDYPQRIRYWREGRELRARTSLMDGSKVMEWRYQSMGGGAN